MKHICLCKKKRKKYQESSKLAQKMEPNKIISVHIVHILSEKSSLNCVKSVILKNKNGMEQNECFFYCSAALIVFLNYVLQ